MAINTEGWNFRVFLLQGSLRDLTNLIASANLVLPYIYTALGASVFVAGLLMPLVRGFGFAAQLVGAPAVEGSKHHKWYIAGAALASSSALVVVAIASGRASTTVLAVVFVGVAVVIGLATGLSNLAFHDLLGSTLPHRRRMVLLFAQSGISSFLAIVIAGLTAFVIDWGSSLNEYLELVWVGALVTLISAAVIMATREGSGHSVTRTGLAVAGRRVHHRVRASFDRVAHLHWFQRFLVARLLFLSIELAMPFYAIHAATLHQRDARGLSIFVMAASAGALAGAFVWPAIARSSIRLVMVLTAGMAAGGGVLSIVMHSFPDWRATLIYAVVFFLIGGASQGIIVARTLYLIGIAADDDRPYCIAVANIVAGLVAIAGGSVLGVAAHAAHSILPMFVIVVLNVATVLFVKTLAEVEVGSVTAADAMG